MNVTRLLSLAALSFTLSTSVIANAAEVVGGRNLGQGAENVEEVKFTASAKDRVDTCAIIDYEDNAVPLAACSAVRGDQIKACYVKWRSRRYHTPAYYEALKVCGRKGN